MQQKPLATATTLTPSWVRTWMDGVSRRPKITLWLRAILMLAAASGLDILTGLQISVFAFYFVPLFIAAFVINAPSGMAMAVMAALIRVYANFIWPNYMTDESMGLFLVPVWNFLVDLISFLIFAFLFAILREQLKRENFLARCDPLTGAFNLRAFEEAVDLEISRSRRHGAPFTIFYLDLDNFKSVNDTLGHEAGDELLREVARTLHKQLRNMDIVARLGGDEFGVLLPHTAMEGAHLVVERVQSTLLEAIRCRDLPVTVSIGALTFDKTPESFDVALREADQLMYRAKNNGKNRYYHRSHDQFLREEREKESAIDTGSTAMSHPHSALPTETLTPKVI